MCIRDRSYGCKLWTTTKKQDSKIQVLKIAFLRRVKRCSKLDRTKNYALKEEFQVFNFNKKIKDYKQRWKEYLERMSDSMQANKSGNTDGVTSSTLPMPRCEDDNDRDRRIY